MREIHKNFKGILLISFCSLLSLGWILFLSIQNFVQTYRLEYLGAAAGILVSVILLLFAIRLAFTKLLPGFSRVTYPFLSLAFEIFFIMIFVLAGTEIRINYYNTAFHLGIVNTILVPNTSYLGGAQEYIFDSLFSISSLLFGNGVLIYPYLLLITEVFMSGMVFLYTRRLGGRAAGVLALGIMMLFPTQYSAMTSYHSDFLFLGILFLSLWVFEAYISFDYRRSKSVLYWILTLILVIVIGFSIFLNPRSLVLLLSMILFIVIFSKRYIDAILLIFGSMAFYLGFALLKAIDLTYSYEMVLREDCKIFLNGWITADCMSHAFSLPAYPDVLQLSYIILLCLGWISVIYFLRKKRIDFLVMEIFFSSILLLFSLQYPSESHISYMIAYTSVLFASLVNDFFCTKKIAQVKQEECTATDIVKEDTVQEVTAQEITVKPAFIENPLPEPKRHVPKSLDFDIEVDDDDDFDI